MNNDDNEATKKIGIVTETSKQLVNNFNSAACFTSGIGTFQLEVIERPRVSSVHVRKVFFADNYRF